MSDTFVVTIPYATAHTEGLLAFDEADRRLWQYAMMYCYDHSNSHSKYNITLSDWQEVTYGARFGGSPIPAGVRRSDIYQYRRAATVALSNPKHFRPII